MAKQVVQIVLQCSASGVQVVQGNLNALGNTANKTQNSLSELKRLLGGLATAATIRQTILLADSYARMLNRLRVVTNSNQELYAAMAAVERISRDTRTSLEANVDLYARVALNVRQLGISQRDIVRFSQSLNHALILSGVTAREAHWGMVQLSQGMASGALRGDELRAVMEQLPVVSDVLAKHLGVTRGELRLLAFQGKVTTQAIITAFREAEDELAERFGRRIPTIDESLTALASSFTSWLGRTDQAVGGTRAIAIAIKFLSDNMDIAGPLVSALATAIGVGLVGSLIKAKSVVAILSAAFGPWGRAIGAVVAATVLLVQHWDDVLITLAKVADWVNNNFNGVLEKTGAAIDKLVDRIKQLTSTKVPELAEATTYAKYRHDQALLEKLMKDRGLTPVRGELPPGMSTDWLEQTGKPRQAGPTSFEEQTRAWVRARKAANAELSDVVSPVGWKPSQEQQQVITGLQKAMTGYTQSIDIYRQSLNDSKLTQEEHEQLLRQIRDGASHNMDVLRQAYSDGLFTEEEYTRKSIELSQERLKSATDAASGVARGLNEVWLTMTDFASLTQQTVRDAFGGIEDSIVSLATTGKANIKSMVDSVLADLTRLLLRQTLFNFLGLAGGAGAEAGGTSGTGAGSHYGTLYGGRANGGNVTAGNPVWVGEQGKEIFVPKQDGTIVPHNQVQGATAAPVVNVIQVMSMEEALAAMRSTEGQRIIVNAKGRAS